MERRTVSDHQSVKGRQRGGFTLIEVVLAVGIATGILLVALVLYRQAADLRARILQESERLAAIRMLLDRLSGELRMAQASTFSGGGFAGDASSMRFVRLTLNAPTPSFSPPSTNSTDRTDLLKVALSTVMETNGTQVVVRALMRREEAFEGYQRDVKKTPPTESRETLMDALRFVRFRYWDGVFWSEVWSNSLPPQGVEIVLATDPKAEGAPNGAIPSESFRRVVHLSAGVVPKTAESNQIAFSNTIGEMR